ncbi:MAG: carboxypeptidase-like regulatory domain-containing protein, partial [Flavobacteriales bacterium]
MKKHQLAFKTILLLFLALSSSCSIGQTTKVKGKVLDESNNPMPFVNINFVNSHIGTTTDFDGMHSIETKWATDSLSASFLGYQKEAFNTMNFMEFINDEYLSLRWSH